MGMDRKVSPIERKGCARCDAIKLRKREVNQANEEFYNYSHPNPEAAGEFLTWLISIDAAHAAIKQGKHFELEAEVMDDVLGLTKTATINFDHVQHVDLKYPIYLMPIYDFATKNPGLVLFDGAHRVYRWFAEYASGGQRRLIAPPGLRAVYFPWAVAKEFIRKGPLITWEMQAAMVTEVADPTGGE